MILGPNITGSFRTTRGDKWQWPTRDLTGAFIHEGDSSDTIEDTGSREADPVGVLSFNANSASQLFNSEISTIQPESAHALIIIKA